MTFRGLVLAAILAIAPTAVADHSTGLDAGLVCVQTTADARCTLAVSGTGDASGSFVAASGTGSASTLSAIGVAASGLGNASACATEYALLCVAVSGAGHADCGGGTTCVSASLAGDATCRGRGCLVAVAPLGHAECTEAGVCLATVGGAPDGEAQPLLP